ncbi:hypothetical protein CFR75_05980 [Komagataeibacter xylinus]|uniref:Uncharacterized protein n=2 Tax=Komagataeibacter xylinus TaxID=28448 RepID=A0A318PJK6_KOMXY|nr:hypothetical protein [Komagataeibacter xylinus]PYD57367.1 hypothetical protein CFR75_05980 [Komagataeibacter xylinus]GBQ80567.1 hypothetical protein AA15237_3016 [Komagataeibacter xylinus NBRC 15237]
MTQHINLVAVDGGRRRFLGRALMSAAAIAAATALPACTVTKNGDITTLTLNVAAIKDYGQAGLNAVSTILSIAALASAIGAPTVAIINAGDTALDAALNAFSSAAGSTLTITYDDTDWKSRVDSVLSALGTVEKDLSAAITGVETKVASTDLSNANTALNALATIVSAFKALLDSVAVRRPVGAMASATPAPSQAQVQQALRVLGVTA